MQFKAKMALLALLLFTGAQLALAQQPAAKSGDGRGSYDPIQKADQRTEAMAKTLNLNEIQRSKVQAIHRKYAQAPRGGQGVKSKTDGAAPTEAERKARREQMETARNQKNAELKSVLTPEQWATWEKEKANRKGGHGGNCKKGPKTKKA